VFFVTVVFDNNQKSPSTAVYENNRLISQGTRPVDRAFGENVVKYADLEEFDIVGRDEGKKRIVQLLQKDDLTNSMRGYLNHTTNKNLYATNE
jgi:hypothetical protein